MVMPAFLECGGKRSATPLWILQAYEASVSTTVGERSKAPSPLRSAGAVQGVARAGEAVFTTAPLAERTSVFGARREAKSSGALGGRGACESGRGLPQSKTWRTSDTPFIRVHSRPFAVKNPCVNYAYATQSCPHSS
jgi:hypothetical protein